VDFDLTVPKDTPTGDYVIGVSARSLGAAELGFNVTKNATFTLHVTSGPGDGDGTGEQEDLMDVNVVLLIGTLAAVLAVILLILFMWMRRRKGRKAEEAGVKPGNINAGMARAVPIPPARPKPGIARGTPGPKGAPGAFGGPTPVVPAMAVRPTVGVGGGGNRAR
jgi:hypothetical protein